VRGEIVFDSLQPGANATGVTANSFIVTEVPSGVPNSGFVLSLGNNLVTTGTVLANSFDIADGTVVAATFGVDDGTLSFVEGVCLQFAAGGDCANPLLAFPIPNSAEASFLNFGLASAGDADSSSLRFVGEPSVEAVIPFGFDGGTAGAIVWGGLGLAALVKVRRDR